MIIWRHTQIQKNMTHDLLLQVNIAEMLIIADRTVQNKVSVVAVVGLLNKILQELPQQTKSVHLQ